MAYTSIGGAGTLIRSGNNAILPISDAQFIQYENDDLDVVNVRDGLDALSDNVSSLTDDTPFWVTISDDRGTLSCSHTYTQITTAIGEGKKVLAFYSPSSSYSQVLANDRPVVLNCVWTTQETTLKFRAPTGGEHDIIEFYMDANHPIAVTYLDYSETNHTHTNESMGQGYGTTTTGGSTATKTVTLSGYELKKGGIVSVYFSYAHTASSLSLNINSKGAKTAYYNSATTATTAIGSGVINAGDIATFMYDGSYYRLLGVNSGFHNGYGSCSTAAATTAKTASITNYKLKVGGIASIRFTNEVPASATLNINSTGAKSIYYNNAAITADVIKAGDTATFMYDGTYYRLISIDKTAPLDSPALSGTPTAPTAAAGTNTTQIATTAFVTTAVSNNTLKYTVKAVSSNAVSFTTSAKMLPNTVYVCGVVDANTNMITFGLVNSLSIASGAFDSDIGMMWSTRQAAITSNKVVPTYQIVFRCGSSGASITLPNNIVWRDGSAPAASDLVNKWCELTIMNDIATIIII